MGHHLEKKYPVVYIDQAQALKTPSHQSKQTLKDVSQHVYNAEHKWLNANGDKTRNKGQNTQTDSSFFSFSVSRWCSEAHRLIFLSSVFFQWRRCNCCAPRSGVSLSLSPSLFPNLSFPSEPILCRSQRTQSSSSSYLVTFYFCIHTRPLLGLSLFILS